uniref:TLC domain-containing protein n=1 Tax=Physcomitrium patens TaxID=3218 RepID=A0A7I4CNK0_PHYPA
MVSIWETERPPSVQDYYLVCYFALAFPVARFLLDCFLYQKLARWCIFPHGVKGLKNGAREAGEKKIPKFTESAWKLTYYLATEVFVIFITYKEAWFGNTSAFWHGWPYQTVKFQLTLFYTFQCGFYIYSVAALLFWETRRKDFDVMMTHHIVTIGLIAYSYITGSFRAGSIVLALHDVSDVFMEAAKLCKYSGSEVGASVSFGLFVLSWVLLRLIYFPFWIIWSTSNYEIPEKLERTFAQTLKMGRSTCCGGFWNVPEPIDDIAQHILQKHMISSLTVDCLVNTICGSAFCGVSSDLYGYQLRVQSTCRFELCGGISSLL